MPSRIQSDGVDREKLKDRLNTCIDPLQPDSHPPGLINVVTGRLCPDNVNVDDSVNIGTKQMNEYELHWPESFNKHENNKDKVSAEEETTCTGGSF